MLELHSPPHLTTTCGVAFGFYQAAGNNKILFDLLGWLGMKITDKNKEAFYFSSNHEMFCSFSDI